MPTKLLNHVIFCAYLSKSHQNNLLAWDWWEHKGQRLSNFSWCLPAPIDTSVRSGFLLIAFQDAEGLQNLLAIRIGFASETLQAHQAHLDASIASTIWLLNSHLSLASMILDTSPMADCSIVAWLYIYLFLENFAKYSVFAFTSSLSTKHACWDAFADHIGQSNQGEM